MSAQTLEKAQEPQKATLQHAAKWVCAYALLLLAIYISGTKPIGTSADLRNYQILYNISAVDSWRTILSNGDFGYFGLSKIAAAAGWSFDLFAFVLAAVTCILLFLVAQRIDTNRPVLIATYGSYLFWLHEYTQIRAAAAIAIALFAIYVARPSLRWALFVPAVLLHNSLVLLVGAYYLVRIRRLDVLIALGLIALFLALGPLAPFVEALLRRILAYQDLAASGQFTDINLFSLMPLLQIAGIGCAFLYFSKLPREGREETILAIAGVMAFYAASPLPVLAFRTFELFMPFYVILLSRLSQISKISWGVIAVLILLGLRSSFFSSDSLVIL